MNKPLNGFTFSGKISARCPAGHNFYITLENLIPPTEKFNTEEFESIKYSVQRAYDLLRLTPCEECAKALITGWR